MTPVGASGTVGGIATGAEAVEGALLVTEFFATTVNVYVLPGERPETLQDVVVDVQVSPPGDEVAVYNAMAEPPLNAGATHETWAAVGLIGVPVTAVGASGAVAEIVTPADPALRGPSPTALVATILNVYVCPLVKPTGGADTVHAVDGASAVHV